MCLTIFTNPWCTPYIYCNAKNSTTTTTTSTIDDGLTNATTIDYPVFQIPSVVFFRSLFHNFDFLDPNNFELAWSWQLLFCMFVVWALIAFFFYKVTDLEKIALYIRYSIWTIAALMFLCLIRFSFLEGAAKATHSFFIPELNVSLRIILVFWNFSLFSFGAGWGVVISLASYNKFQTNIMSYSWIICIGQGLIVLLFSLTTYLIDSHFESITANGHGYHEEEWSIYLSSGTAMANMRFANLWCILFFSMLTISSMLMIVIQLFAFYSAVFDDFEFLRARKQEVTFGLIGFLALGSIYFCSNHGMTSFMALAADCLFTQTTLNLLLILVVLWIYGRERFQRDIQFMLGQTFATWRIYMLRFVAPLVLLLTLLISLAVAFQTHVYETAIFVGGFAILVIVIPWLFVPGYAGFRMFQQTTGTFCERFKRCSHPTDWYPVEAEYRQRYQEAVGNMDITHQLNEVRDEIL